MGILSTYTYGLGQMGIISTYTYAHISTYTYGLVTNGISTYWGQMTNGGRTHIHTVWDKYTKHIHIWSGTNGYKHKWV